MRAEQLAALAADFWERAGAPATFPRDLEPAVPLAVPVSVEWLDGLRPLAVRRWLLRRGMRLPLAVRDRPLDGCVVAYRCQAVIFLAAGLEAAHARMVLAHELGHFLADYDWPRRRVLRRLGTSVLPVLDGERPPAPGEDLAGVLAGVALGAHVHYMERSIDPRLFAATDRVEHTASTLACELLAPRHEVLDRVKSRGLPGDRDSWGRLLRDEFGLPESWADLYAARLLRGAARRRTFTDRLGL